jgi:hypothetical protein
MDFNVNSGSRKAVGNFAAALATKRKLAFHD